MQHSSSHIASLGCSICSNFEGNREHIAREMMFGMRDRFRYLECGACGSLQLLDIPDLQRYYPAEYYSLHEPWLKGWLKAVRARHSRKSSLLGHVITALAGPARLHWLHGIELGLEDPILDVGGGAGQILNELAAVGYSDLTCIDPYASKAMRWGKVIRGHLRDAPPRDWKLIMFHHSFEHLQDPIGTLRTARALVAPGGYVVIRMPLAGKYAWRRYGVNWVNLDAPRHIFVFSEDAFVALARRAGFIVERTFFDSAPAQLWVSEQYERDIPFNEIRRPTRREMKRYQAEADELNLQRDGDQACFTLRPVTA